MSLTTPPPDPPGGTQPFSLAFDNMVQEPDDTVGLLAYALFKQSIREDAARGVRSNGATRNPTPTTIEVYRNSAKRRLQDFANKAIEEATPDLQQSAYTNAISTLNANLSTVQANLMSHVDRRTSMWGAIVTNIVATILILAITVLIIQAVYLPNWQADLIEAVKKGAETSTRQNTPTKPPGG